MSLSQAVELVLNASKIAQGAEIFVLKMPVVIIKDLIEIVIEEYSKTVLFNATFQVPTIYWTAYYNFFTDLIDDSEVTVNVTGLLTVQAPSLFWVVTAEVEMHTEVVLVTDLIFETIKD